MECKLNEVFNFIINFNHVIAWFEFWLPVLSGLSQQCYHPSREVRQHSLTMLQRVLLSTELKGPDMTASATSCSESRLDCFENVLFPLLDELMKPEVVELDPLGIDETRVRASALLAKTFLRFYTRLSKSKELAQVWTRTLDYMGQSMHSGTLGREEYLVNHYIP